MAEATPSPLIEQARKQWTRAAEAEDPQRKAILLAKEFRALKQWPDAIRLAREGAGSISGQPPQPARPCLVVDRLSPAVRNISNQIKNADFGFDVLPNGGGADRETAEILKGYLRRVQNQSRGESPIEWAADGAIEAGLGWLRLKTDYVHQDWTGDPNNPEAYDQELQLRRIPNSLSVYCDPSAMHPTRADAQFIFVVEDLDKDAFKDRFPTADLRGLEEFQSTGDMSTWVSKDTIRVAEYWRVTYAPRTIWAAKDGRAGEGAPPKDADVLFQRVIRAPVVKGSLINAVQELEPFKWLGRRIPIFPILGEELNVDGKPLLRGVIGPGMDAQRMVNYTFSGAVEIFALGNKSPFIVPAAAIANYKSVWDTANIYNYSYLPFDEWNDNQRQNTAPRRDQADAPIQAAVALMQIAEDSVKASTITGDASLGNTNPNERSGKALEALQAQSELGNSNYADNVRRTLIDIAQEAVYIIPKITRPGQVWHIMGMDDKPEQVIVGKPFMPGEDGVPQPAPDGVTPEIARQKDNLYKFYDPTAGIYATTVTIGKATATRQQEGSRALGELIPHLPPEMAAVATPAYVRQMSFPGAQGIAEQLEKTLPPHLRADGEQGADAMPPEAQAQIQQLQQQLQEATQPLAIERERRQTALEVEDKKIAFQREKLDVESETKLAVAELGAKVDRLALFLEERARLGVQAHEVGMTAMGHAASADAQTAEQRHAAEMQDKAQQAEAVARAEAAEQERKARASQEKQA